MTHYLGICDYCRKARIFTSAEARDEWKTNHPCGDDDE